MTTKFSELYNKNFLIQLYEIEKLSSYAIANRIGCSQYPVLAALKRFNIQPHKWNSWKIIKDSNGVIDNKDIIDGLMLGDGGIQNRYSTPRLKIRQKQRELVEFLRDNLCPCRKIYIEKPSESVIEGRIIHRDYSYVCVTKASAVLNSYYRRWYINKIKIIPKDLTINPVNLLHWFIGDGSSYKTGNSIQISLATLCFTKDEVDFLVEKFSDIGIGSYYYRKNLSKENRGFSLYIKNSYAREFYRFMAPCPVKCMEYKWKL